MNLIEILQFWISWIPQDSIWYNIAQAIIGLIFVAFILFCLIKAIKNGDKARVSECLNSLRKIMETAAKSAEQLKSKNQVDQLSAEAKREIVLATIKNACVEYGMEYVEEYWNNELADYIANTKEINYRG